MDGSIKIMLEPTKQKARLNGFEFRVFKGRTNTGIEIEMLGPRFHDADCRTHRGHLLYLGSSVARPDGLRDWQGTSTGRSGSQGPARFVHHIRFLAFDAYSRDQCRSHSETAGRIMWLRRVSEFSAIAKDTAMRFSYDGAQSSFDLVEVA